MRPLIVAVVAAAVTGGAISAPHRPAERLPFYQTRDRTPEWIVPGTARYRDIHRVGDFSLTDQDGHTITTADVRGKIYVASFFFTACRQLCPKLQSNLALVERAFRDDDHVLILSHSVTPETDDTAALHRYAITNHINHGTWHLLTGASDVITTLARDGYFAALPDTIDGNAITLPHSETFVLADEEQRIRGVYDGSLPYDVERLIDDIRELRRDH